jgi:hypothetical protein
MVDIAMFGLDKDGKSGFFASDRTASQSDGCCRGPHYQRLPAHAAPRAYDAISSAMIPSAAYGDGDGSAEGVPHYCLTMPFLLEAAHEKRTKTPTTVTVDP